MNEYLTKKETAFLIARRHELKMSIYALSNKLGYKSVDRLKDIEKGAVKIPTSKLQLWCDVLDVTPEEVIMANMDGTVTEKSPINTSFALHEDDRKLKIESYIHKLTDKEFDMLVEFADMLVRYHNYL